MLKPFFTLTALLLTFVAGAGAYECEALEMSQPYGYSSEDLLGGGSYLGVDTRDITADRLGVLKLKEERGVEVTMVDQDAPAGRAGLKEHDVIMSVNGTSVESVEQLRRVIHEIPAGRVASVGLSREGKPLSIKVQLGDRHKAFAWSDSEKNFKFEMPNLPTVHPFASDMDMPASIVVVHSSVRSGLMVENMTPQLSEFFGVKNGQGVLVRSVEKGSRAEKAGFRAGDVIVKINGETVNDSGDFTHAIRKRKDNTASIGIVRERKPQELTLTLPEPGPSSEFMDESFEMPVLSGEARNQLIQSQSELAQMKPELERSTQEMRKNSEELEKQAAEWRRQVEE